MMFKMNKILLQKVTHEQYEKTVGTTFGTVGTDQGSVVSRYPTWEKGGNELHSSVSFQSYEEYLKYTE